MPEPFIPLGMQGQRVRKNGVRQKRDAIDQHILNWQMGIPSRKAEDRVHTKLSRSHHGPTEFLLIRRGRPTQISQRELDVEIWDVRAF